MTLVSQKDSLAQNADLNKGEKDTPPLATGFAPESVQEPSEVPTEINVLAHWPFELGKEGQPSKMSKLNSRDESRSLKLNSKPRDT